MFFSPENDFSSVNSILISPAEDEWVQKKAFPEDMDQIVAVNLEQNIEPFTDFEAPRLIEPNFSNTEALETYIPTDDSFISMNSLLNPDYANINHPILTQELQNNINPEGPTVNEILPNPYFPPIQEILESEPNDPDNFDEDLDFIGSSTENKHVVINTNGTQMMENSTDYTWEYYDSTESSPKEEIQNSTEVLEMEHTPILTAINYGIAHKKIEEPDLTHFPDYPDTEIENGHIERSSHNPIIKALNYNFEHMMDPTEIHYAPDTGDFDYSGESSEEPVLQKMGPSMDDPQEITESINLRRLSATEAPIINQPAQIVNGKFNTHNSNLWNIL